MLSIWYVDPATMTDDALLARFRSWLDDTEKQRMDRFVQPKHQHAFLVSHALVRRKLSDELGCEPCDIKFTTCGRGKPVLSSDHHLHFNLSHTDGLAALAIANHPIGLDVEWLGRKGPGLDLAHRYFTDNEYRDIASQPREQQHHRLLTYWTLKEAYLKAQGWGIVDSLDGFEFALEPRGNLQIDRIELIIRHQALAPTFNWNFHHRRIGNAHLLSIASVATAAEVAEVPCQAWQPQHH